MTRTCIPDVTIALVPDSMVALHPLDRLTDALDVLEAALRQATRSTLALSTVLRFFEAGEVALASPIAERRRLQEALLASAYEDADTLPEWGLALRSGAVVVTDPVQLGLQLAAYPWLSRIVLKRLASVWRRALAAATAR